MEIQEMEPITCRDTDRKALFETLYIQVFPKAARYISNRGGSFEDAKDIFQDALVAWYEKSCEPGFEIRISAEAYLMGIVKHLWLRVQNNNNKLPLNDTIENIATPENGVDVNTTRLLSLLERTGKKCMNLLRSFYYEEQSVKEIAAAGDYSNEHSVSVQKYKCLEKIRDIVKEKSISYEAFTD